MDSHNEMDELQYLMKYLNENFHRVLRTGKLNKLLSEDMLSLAMLAPLMNGEYPYIPFTGGSLRPFCLNHIINDVVINNRERIIEFGSGLSTVFIARAIKKNDLKSTLTSIEHDKDWSRIVRQMLEKENLGDYVEIITAPLKKCRLSNNGDLWYDLQKLDRKFEEKTFDMVIVDGPPAWEKDRYLSRYPALPFLKGKLKKHYSIYLDDANREGEKKIIALWENEFDLKFKLTGNSLAFHYQGKSFFTEPHVHF